VLATKVERATTLTTTSSTVVSNGSARCSSSIVPVICSEWPYASNVASSIIAQPHVVASLFVQKQPSVSLEKMLLVCFQAMKESGLTWPLIAEDEQ
jgi:hypothetical protein